MQFRFVQLQYPGVVIAFEKMLMAGCLPVAAAVVTWGVVAGTGMSNACFFLAALLCALYYLFGLPLPSSFHLGSRGRVAMGEPAGELEQGPRWLLGCMLCSLGRLRTACGLLPVAWGMLAVSECTMSENHGCRCARKGARGLQAPVSSQTCAFPRPCRRLQAQDAHAAGCGRRLCRLCPGGRAARRRLPGHPLGGHLLVRGQSRLLNVMSLEH